MHLQAHLRSAWDILQQYKGDLPLAAWLKNYFRQNKKFGSRDRKYITDLCFCYFRLGKAFGTISGEDRLLLSQFICHEGSPFVRELKPEWLESSFLPVSQKIRQAGYETSGDIFPLHNEISAEIEKETFQLSFLKQPDLFLRIRPGKEQAVIRKLKTAGLAFEQEAVCLRLPNTTKVDEILQLDEEAVVQDRNSQKVLAPLQRLTPNFKPQTSVWDCCAASGGKTILLHDLYPKASLTVSDVRESILINLKNRLKRAGILSFHSFVADIASPKFSLDKKFDVVICDAPCSGSGTWGRTPEQLVFFRQDKIAHYANLQKNIALNAGRCLRKGGAFLYITCSVFYRENEDVVNYLQQNSGLRFVSQQYFSGYSENADTMFTALFTAG